MHRAGQVVSISSISSSSSCRRKRGKHVSDCCFHDGRPACPQSTKHLAPSSHQAHVSNALKQLLPWPLLPLSPRHHTTALARQLPLKISPNGIERTIHKILSFHYFSDKNQITIYILALTKHELELRYESSTLILYKELSSSIFQSCQSVSQASVTPVQISTLCNI